MSTIELLEPADTAGSPRTLADLRRRILADADLPPARRADIASALNTLAKALGQPLDAIPAEPAALRARLDGATSAQMGHRPGRWRNIRSLVSAALARVGRIRLPARLDLAPAPAWEALLKKPLPRDARFRLGRFARYCTAQGIDPAEVDDAVLARFRADLETGSLVADPARAQREAALRWNLAAAAHPDWPQQRLTVPDHRLYYTPDWTAYPPGLLADIEAWLGFQQRDGLDDLLSDAVPVRRVRPTTLRNRRAGLRLYLGALVLSGEDPRTMVDLRSVVLPARARIALGFFLQRAGNTPSHHTAQIARLAFGIARHWARLDPTDLERLRIMARKLTPPKRGMTARNAARLRPFDNESVRDRLLDLPARLCDEAERGVRRLGAPNVALARLWQTAVLIEIELAVPLRMANLAGLRIGTHLVRLPGGGLVLVLDGEEVKNGLPLEVALPAGAAAMVTRYIERYRPLLGAAGSDWLFPGRTPGRRKSHDGVRDQITKTLAERCGVAMHPHLFRHLAGKLILDQDPKAHGLVQRVLGHKHLGTTMGFYTGLETARAVRHYQEIVQGGGPQPRRDQRGRR
jgi:integrase